MWCIVDTECCSGRFFHGFFTLLALVLIARGLFVVRGASTGFFGAHDMTDCVALEPHLALPLPTGGDDGDNYHQEEEEHCAPETEKDRSNTETRAATTAAAASVNFPPAATIATN